MAFHESYPTVGSNWPFVVDARLDYLTLKRHWLLQNYSLSFYIDVFAHDKNTRALGGGCFVILKIGLMIMRIGKSS